jgi:hypothetical protein
MHHHAEFGFLEKRFVIHGDLLSISASVYHGSGEKSRIRPDLRDIFQKNKEEILFLTAIQRAAARISSFSTAL